MKARLSARPARRRRPSGRPSARPARRSKTSARRSRSNDTSGRARDRAGRSTIRPVNRGFGLIEILIVLVVVALAGTFLYKYVMSTTATVETLKEQRPLAGAKLAADVAPLGTHRPTVRTHCRGHRGPPAG